MHKLIIQYNDQISMLNLRNGKTYTISNDKEADITFKLLEEPIHLEQNEQGVWQAITRQYLKNLNIKRTMAK